MIKQRFLLLLENDLPSYILCYTCNRLYNWRAEELFSYSCPGRGRYPSLHRPPARLCGIHTIRGFERGSGRRFHITQEERDLILRADLKGSDYGLPVTHIAHECVHTKVYNPEIQGYVRLRPKIVASSLLLWKIEEVKVDPSSDLTQQLKVLRKLACYHVQTPLSVIATCAISHIPSRTVPPNGWRCQQTFKCSYCATDLRLYVILCRSNEILIRVESWQDFSKRARNGSVLDLMFDHDYRRKHEDAARLRDLEKLYNEGSMAPDTEVPESEARPRLSPRDHQWMSLRGERVAKVFPGCELVPARDSL